MIELAKTIKVQKKHNPTNALRDKTKTRKRRELQAKTQDKFNYTNFLFYEACQS